MNQKENIEEVTILFTLGLFSSYLTWIELACTNSLEWPILEVHILINICFCLIFKSDFYLKEGLELDVFVGYLGHV